MVNNKEQLRRTVEWRAANRAKSNLAGLGDILNGLVEKQISPRQARFEIVDDAWRQLLPAELCQHCRIENITGGRLEVSVDSPPYLYELRLLSTELVKELSRRYPRTRIKEINFALG